MEIILSLSPLTGRLYQKKKEKVGQSVWMQQLRHVPSVKTQLLTSWPGELTEYNPQSSNLCTSLVVLVIISTQFIGDCRLITTRGGWTRCVTNLGKDSQLKFPCFVIFFLRFFAGSVIKVQDPVQPHFNPWRLYG